MKKTLLLLTILIALNGNNVFAEETPDKLTGAIGMGAMYSERPYKEYDDEVIPVPLIKLNFKRFFIDGYSLGMKLTDNKDLFTSIIIQPRLTGYDSDDSTFLSGMEDRDWALDGGLRLTWNNPWFALDLNGLTDMTNTHEGQEVNAFLSKEFFDGFLKPRIGVRWLSESLIDYYYGVRSNEATALRPSYEGDATVDYVGGVMVAVPVGDTWAIISDVKYEYLGSEIRKSPIVDHKDNVVYVAGIVYRF